jgi:hypothetical protein
MVRLAAARASATPPIVGWTIFSALIWFTLGRAIRRRGRSAFTVRFGTACLVGAACVVAIGVMAPAVVAQSGIAVFPDTLTFASQIVSTTTPPQVLYLTNIGVATLNITSIAPSGDFSVVTDCGTTLAVGQSCGAAVSFTPTAIGARSGTLTITDDAAGSPHMVTLNGTGQTAPATGTGTPAGTYSVAVSGIAGTMTHAASLTLTVQ